MKTGRRRRRERNEGIRKVGGRKADRSEMGRRGKGWGRGKAGQ